MLTDGPPDFTPEQKLKLLSVITEQSHTDESDDKLVKDVDALITTTRDIRDMFLNTAASLSIIDNATAPDGNPLNNTGEPFTPQWEGFSTRFDDLIETSTTKATVLGTACIAFDGTLLPMLLDTTSPDRMTLKEKREAIEGFITEIDTGATDGKDMKEKFRALQLDLSEFAGTFGEFVSQRLGVLEGDIAEYRSKIKHAQAQIDKLNSEIDGWMVAIGVSIFSALVAAALLPGYGLAIAGAALLAVIGEGGAIGQLASEKAGWEKKKEGYEQSIADLQTQVNAIYECQQALGQGQSTVPRICSALGSFEDVWQGVKAHCVSILFYLNLAGGSLEDEPLCKIYLEKGKTYIGPLGKAMNKYGELQDDANGSGYSVEKHVPTNLLLWGNTHPLLKMGVKAIFKLYNFPITAV